MESMLRIDFVGDSLVEELGDLIQDLHRVLNPLRDSERLINVGSTSFVHLEVTEAPNSGWRLHRNGRLVSTTTSATTLRQGVLASVNAGAIEALSRSVGFHAGAVEFPKGVVVFPGVSNAGKSTLVTQLLQRGHRYLTDEASAIGVESGEVMPFTKSLCIDLGGRQLFPELAPVDRVPTRTWDVDPSAIGTGIFGSGGPPIAFVFPRYQPGAAVRCERLSGSNALVRLLENSFDFHASGAEGAAMLLELAEKVPCFALTHSGQREHLEMLEGQFGRAD